MVKQDKVVLSNKDDRRVREGRHCILHESKHRSVLHSRQLKDSDTKFRNVLQYDFEKSDHVSRLAIHRVCCIYLDVYCVCVCVYV